MQRDAILQLLDHAEREHCCAFIFDGDEVEVVVGVEGTTLVLEPGRLIELSQVKFAGLI